MRIPFARTSAETTLFLELSPCSCGNGEFPGRGLPWSASVLAVGAENTLRYDWDCPGCGRYRQYLFRAPREPEPFPRAGEMFRWGDGATPSQLLDPGQWMLVADRYARTDGVRAAAAVDEVLLFVRKRMLGGGWSVPRSAFRTAAGRARYRRAPREFTRDRLESARNGYRDDTVKR
ncbi:hypothetical protein GCM10010168_38870 [Actinoplanes ianthinogenes]|uniref:Uncharacterized protein n=1 Tax=Actinoplanes ianthinogenes TaxID=122358 RepID=A0ABM7M4L2_9ACTN|nr:hypothetical protein [Actinoplanes ianthinogenes]BCJ46590.1 hypothetical protein Aiant_72470 [Actinoplanes ianthinogenes]GGR17121.1 hypothetical protein GCM10010168_38870 [Actinoplanes ianthinogenes]